MWERSAEGWDKRRDELQRVTLPVSRWLIDAIGPQPGQTVLELAAGPGDTGLLAAELIAPGGTLVCSDFAEEMLAAARGRAEALGLDNVEFKQLEMEWIDLDTASVDSVLCRWAYMLLADPGAAFRETRRVLRPGGRLALAVWDAPEDNPWAQAPNTALIDLGLAPPRDLSKPGMFSLSQPGRVAAFLSEAGFDEPVVETVSFEYRFGSFDEWLDWSTDIGRAFGDFMRSLDEETNRAVRERMTELVAEFAAPDGVITFPARTIVASATA